MLYPNEGANTTMTTTDLTALYREDATEQEQIECYQHLIDTGDAWRLEGNVGRTAMELIEAGHCMLGPVGHRDYWGNYVPSRTEVEAGTKGSASFVEATAALREYREQDPLYVERDGLGR